MKILLTVLCILFVLIALSWVTPEKKQENLSGIGMEWIKKEANAFISSVEQLRKSLSLINSSDSATVIDSKEALKRCRLQYKRIAFFIEYYFPGEAYNCNGPLKVDVDDDEPLEPMGMQRIESYLFEADPSKYKKEFERQTSVMTNSVKSVVSILNDFTTEDKAFLESLQLELIRIMTLYVEGFDAPQLKSGIEEAYEALVAIETSIQPFLRTTTHRDSISFYLVKSKEFIKKHIGFDSFDRLTFITDCILPLQRLTNTLNKPSWKFGMNTALNYRAKNLFSPDALNRNAFPHLEDLTDNLKSSLGKQLFFEEVFSQNGKRSCATCHDPQKYFTDGLSRNKILDESDELLRNTPSLLYAHLQFSQFWDGRAASLERQAHTVLTTGHEMSANVDVVIKKLKTDGSYASQFKKIWPKDKESVSFQHAMSALAAYIQTLKPFNSDFDRYIAGEKDALTASQKRGFNLFMGKAACGSCHFAPIFNGLLPPAYTTTEFEILGTPLNENLENPVTDTDLGRYKVFDIEQFKGAFKTPTVRNAAKTAPYMHNGAFTTLEKLIDFYDKGGGAGIGLDVPQQTLPSTALNLTKEEKADIIAFIESLTDRLPTK